MLGLGLVFAGGRGALDLGVRGGLAIRADDGLALARLGAVDTGAPEAIDEEVFKAPLGR